MIVITTPTGLIGHQVLENLIDSGADLRVVARDPSDLPAEVSGYVEVVEGSHGDAAVVDEAFDGADAVFWLAPPDPRAPSVEVAYVDFTRPAAAAFTRHGVRRVVGVSALGRGTPWAEQAGFVTASLAMDDLIAGSGVGYRALTNPSFMDNIARQEAPIANEGIFFSPIDGDRKLPSVATRDVAAAASRLLLDEGWSGFDEVALLGPEDLSFNDMAEIISEVLGKVVRFQQTTFEAYKERFLDFGMSDAMAQGQTDMAWAKNEGLDNAVERTSENSTPTSFRAWCEKVLKPAVIGQTGKLHAPDSRQLGPIGHPDSSNISARCASVRECRLIARSLERRVARHDPCRKSAVVQPEDEIREIVDRESHAWDTHDVELLLSVFHPDMVWVWPRTDTSTDPIDWVVKMGRFNTARWRRVYQELFARYELAHNRRSIVKIEVSAEGDGAMAVVDIDTLWRERTTGDESNHWLGRTCKVYALIESGWKMTMHTGALRYE